MSFVQEVAYCSARVNRVDKDMAPVLYPYAVQT